MPNLFICGGKDVPIPEYLSQVANIVVIRDTAQLTKFLHGALDALSGRGTAGSLAAYRSFAPMQELLHLDAALQSLYRNVVRHRLTREQFAKDLTTLELDEATKVSIIDAVLGRMEEVALYAAVDASQISRASLDDFDWKLQLILSSDKLADVKRPSAIVEFDICDVNGEKSKKTLDLSKEELDTILSSFSQIQSTFNKFST
eukprot:TRINITY_DN5126_c0_g1_i1.p1 TRINITY_DN5126_c0_g1~~TRINITY_DN5126_c0_g1_i1.p1  ORF type:complete len:202 (+),score=56.04 TRINITY_DN5126_c0_g1_i1:54-659(+)